MTFKNFFFFKEPKQINKFVLNEQMSKSNQSDESSDENSANSSRDNLLAQKVNKNIKKNMEIVKQLYSMPDNAEVMVREFEMIIKNKSVSAFIIFFDGMVDSKILDTNILGPLMLLSGLDLKEKSKSMEDYIEKRLIAHNQVKKTNDFLKIADMINLGGCAIFVDGIENAFLADVKSWEHRPIGSPVNEKVIMGPSQAFNEVARINVTLVRRILKDHNLISESMLVGKKSKTPCYMLYIKDITNEKLINEVKRRIENIDIDYIVDSGELEQYIEDSTLLLSPQIISTERPDKVAHMIVEGKIAVILDGSPFALIMPITMNELMYSIEDQYSRFPYINMIRIIRFLGLILALLLPGIYMAIINFHFEMIPTDLLLAIEASREKVPFPALVEILIMEISFELIIEASIRVPSPTGPTLGIVGALILGQAAVQANIVSPILIIIVSVTAISSFVLPNMGFKNSIRVLRFFYIFTGSVMGFIGIAFGLFINILLFARAKSFGVPLLSSVTPVSFSSFGNSITKPPIWKQEERPYNISPKNIKKQRHISQVWKKSR